MQTQNNNISERDNLTNQQGSGWGFVSAVFAYILNWLFWLYFESVNKKIFCLYNPCIKSVDSLFLACSSPVARLYLAFIIRSAGFAGMKDAVRNTSSVFVKFIDRRMAVPWFTGLSPPRT